jgi:hypothetical protein
MGAERKKGSWHAGEPICGGTKIVNTPERVTVAYYDVLLERWLCHNSSKIFTEDVICWQDLPQAPRL